jgi:hypothetical protein
MRKGQAGGLGLFRKHGTIHMQTIGFSGWLRFCESKGFDDDAIRRELRVRATLGGIATAQKRKVRDYE